MKHDKDDPAGGRENWHQTLSRPLDLPYVEPRLRERQNRQDARWKS